MRVVLVDLLLHVLLEIHRQVSVVWSTDCYNSHEDRH